MRWASSISTAAVFDDALAEAVESVGDALAGEAPHLVIAFVSPDFGPETARLADELSGRFPSATVLGCTGGGVIGDGREVEHRPALSLTAAVLPDVEVTPFYLSPDEEQWPSQLPVSAADVPSFVVLPDPFSCDTHRLLDWLDDAYPDSVKVGGMASGADEPDGNALFLGDKVFAAGVVGVALSGDIEVDTVVAQGCRPIGHPMFVTSCERNVAYALDGKPAVQVIQNLYSSLSSDEQQLFRSSLFLGLAMHDEQLEYRHGDFLIRNIVGIDQKSQVLVVGTQLETNQVVQFHLRDARTSADDLEALLARAEHQSTRSSPCGALLFSCLGRGEHLYGRPDHDTDLFRHHFGDVALGGFFCNGEIGPIHGQTFLHGYTSSFGLFRRRHRLLS